MMGEEMSTSIRTQPGSLFVRTATALAVGRSPGEASRFAERWRDTPGVADYLKRAAVGSVGLDDADGLVLPGTAEFLNLVRPRTIIGRLGRLRRVPFNRGAALAVGGATFAWTTDGRPAPVGRVTFERASLPEATATGIVVLTEDLAKQSTPAAESVVREEMIAGLAEFLDEQFIDPAIAPEPEVSPGSITNGAPSTASAGDPATDLAALLAGFDTLDGVAILASERSAIAFAHALPAGAYGAGMLYGFLPLIISSAVGDRLVAVHAPSILLADDGQMAVESARHATIQMDDAPPTPVEAGPLVSLWQTNSTALKVSRTVNWERARADAVHVITGADYSAS